MSRLKTKRKTRPSPRIKIKNHKIWVFGRKSKVTNYRWRHRVRALQRVMSNLDSTLSDVSNVAFDNGFKVHFRVRDKGGEQ